MPNGSRLLTARELALELQVSVQTIGRWQREGRIPARKLTAKSYRYDLSAVIDALENELPRTGEGGGR